MSRKVDVIIVGQGLAGTTLAWQLLNAGLKFVILDREEETTSSRIAAGLVTPITGKRFAKSWLWDFFWPEASDFYRDIERRTKTDYFVECPMLRLFKSTEEREVFEQKQSDFENLTITTDPGIPPHLGNTEHGGFEMQGGRLQVSEYLNCSRRFFTSINAYIRENINAAEDIDLRADGVHLPKLGLLARRIIFCQGFQSEPLRYFEPVRFNPAKGEILRVNFDRECDRRILHSGIWVAPDNETSARVGATYEWDDLSSEPTAAALDLLTSQLDQLLQVNYKVVDQRAAVRPTMHDFRPVVGVHPQHEQIGMFNGLGSKGSLMAPRLARLLSENLLHGTPIPPEVSLSRWFK